VVLGELAPKSIAIQKPVATTMKVAVPLRLFYWLLLPFIYVFNGLANMLLKLIGIEPHPSEANHSSEELQYLLDKGKESGVLNISEHELIKNVFDFNERIVKNIMVPRTKIVAVELTATMDEFIKDRKSTRLNSSHVKISYAVFCYHTHHDLHSFPTRRSSDLNHSSEELQYLLDKGKESGVLNISEHELIKNVFDFNERIVKNIMVPRTKIVAVELTATMDEFI